MRLPLVVLLFTVLAGSSANATEYRVWGFGTRSCGAWTTARAGQGLEGLVDLAWVEGFITAIDHNSARINNASHNIDADAIGAWMDSYCSGHPLDSISEASEALSVELAGRK
jgi:hypothetical protein